MTFNGLNENGINECGNKDYFNVANYVASATNVYTIIRGGNDFF